MTRRRPNSPVRSPFAASLAILLLAGLPVLHGCGFTPQARWTGLGAPATQPAADAARPGVPSPATPLTVDLRRGQMDEAYRCIYASDFAAAERMLSQMATRVVPADAMGPEILFWLGYARQELKDLTGARDAYTRVITTWPASRYATRAGYLLAEMK